MLQFVQSSSDQQIQQPYGAPLAPPQTHIQLMQTPTQNNSSKGVAGGVLMGQQYPQNIIVTDQQGSQRLVNQQNTFQQNVISPNTFVQQYSYSRPQSRQQVQPVQTIVQQIPTSLQRTSVRQEEQVIIRSPQQQPPIYIQQTQQQQQNQQVILQTQPQQVFVQAPPVQPESHQIIVQPQQQQQQVMHYQQQQPHQQQITQTINVHSQPQQMTPVISVAPVSLNLPEETGGIFQLAHVRPELLHSPKNQDIHVQKIHPSTQPAGSSLVARTILGQDDNDEPIENGFISQANHLQFQQQQSSVNQQVRVVKDEQEVFELREKIKILLDNVQELNKTIDCQEQETQDLYTRLLELDHLKRTKTLVDEENEALKLKIQEWQKRYNVLELTLYEKPTLNSYSTGTYYHSEDNSKILNTLKIKQEENEVLKTTIARLELNQTSERNLKEEIHRLNDLVGLKTSQCEEWKNKYLNLEQVHFQQMSFNPQQYTQQQQDQQKQLQQENQGISGMILPSSVEQIQQRGRSPVTYETSALFKKKNDQNVNSNIYQTSNQTLSNGITSYLEDYKSNKTQS